MPRLASIVSLAIALVASRAGAQDRPLPDRVDDAIARGIDNLLKLPPYVGSGNWETSTVNFDQQWGGRTALMTYALLASGVSPNDPRLRRPIEFLRAAEIGGYYALGLRPQVWMYLPRTVDNRAYVERDFRLLVKGMEKDRAKEDFGLFDYTIMDRVRIDLSVSQYGTLGIWACVQLGAEAPEGDAQGNRFSFWRLIDTRWKSLQDPETGGWSYTGRDVSSGSMTAAGVATLFITQDYLANENARGETWSMPREIERGIAFLDADFPKLLGDADYRSRHYTLYGIERVGTASGYKWLGSRDWYAAGADYLCRTQLADGGWKGDYGDDVTTAFSILFLARGREPVMMNKLQFDRVSVGNTTQPSGWNQRWRDAANATRFLSRESERGLNWQVIDLARATIRDLHDAPIAYLSAPRRVPLRLAPESVDKLRAYVESGGIVVLNGDASAADRAATSRPAATVPPMFAAMFPDATYRPLPADHPILRGQQFRGANWKQRPEVFELTNGVRTLALYLADDAGLAWQQNNLRTTREKFELAANIYQYAVDKEHARVKGRSHYVEPDAPTTRPIERNVRVARVKFDGNWDPEPGGWRRLQSLARRDALGVDVEAVDLSADGKLDGFGIAHLTGVGPLRLKQSAIDELARFVADGGTLLVDAAGGDATFDQDAALTLTKLAPAFSPTSRPVTANDPLLAGEKPIAFRYRTFAMSTLGAMTSPRLRVSRIGKGVVIYSPDDLSVGLVGQAVDGIRGYTPEVATEIVMRLVRKAAK